MKKCEFSIYLLEYINDDISQEKKQELKEHLKECKSCQLEMTDLPLIKNALRYRARPLPEEKLLHNYHKEIDQKFATESILEKIYLKFLNIVYTSLIRPSPKVIFAEIIFFIFIGFTSGWLLFYSPEKSTRIAITYQPKHLLLPIYTSDLEFINTFLFESEMILLDLMNTNETELMNKQNLLEKTELAKRLLIKTFKIHEIALQTNETQILSFLTKLEMILYEISNLNELEGGRLISATKQVIAEADLINELKFLQTLVQNSQSKIADDI